ncbi:SUN domain [Sesbania bispinosa]|nr:SUN domain [Sesbania bispinosa]
MKKNQPRHRSHVRCKCQGDHAIAEIFGLSFSFLFSLWCLLSIFYSKLRLVHGTGGVVLEFNESANSTSLGGLSNNNISTSNLVCKLQPSQEEKKLQPPQLPGENVHPASHRNIAPQEQDRGVNSELVNNITHRLESDGSVYNYASESKGSKVVAHNKEAKGAKNILGKDHDKYLRNPCSVGGKFVVIELSEETLVDSVKIANFEHYSSNFKEFELAGSLSYPTESWSMLGNFVAANAKHAQIFKLPEPKWARSGSENDTVAAEISSNDETQKFDAEVTKNPVIVNLLPDSVMELRQQLNGRIAGDTVLKILMQKVRSVEVNLSALEDCIKELNRRQGATIPNLEKELSRLSESLGQSKSEIKDLRQWNTNMEKGISEAESWKDAVSSQLNELARENSMLRLDVQKVVDDQANLETKELAVLATSLIFVCLAALKIISAHMLTSPAACNADKVRQTIRGWVTLFVCCSVTIFVIFFYS